MAKKKNGLGKRLLAEFLFWLHFVIAVVILLMGLFIAWYWVIIALIGLRAQQIIFHDCVITLLEKYEGGMPRGMVYYQLLAKRLIGYRLKKKHVKTTLIIHYGASLLITIAANIYHLRLHL